jgi:hypothetical protein
VKRAAAFAGLTAVYFVLVMCGVMAVSVPLRLLMSGVLWLVGAHASPQVSIGGALVQGWMVWLAIGIAGTLAWKEIEQRPPSE